MSQAGKRSRRGEKNEKPVDESSPVIQMFQGYRTDLDARHDKYERLVKLSRDVTIESKRTIFLLQRFTAKDSNASVLDQAWEKIQEIQKDKFQPIAMELEGEDPYQFLRAYSPGLQEYIEALTFYHYIKSKKLVTLRDIQKDLCFQKTPETDKTTPQSTEKSTDSNEESVNTTEVVSVCVPPTEYMLGLADLTGELMRLAINSVGVGNLDTPFEVCKFLQKMQSAFSLLPYVSREINRKIATLKQSLQKVETACYTLQVRGSEIPKHMLADVFSSGPSQGPMFEDDSMTVDD